MADGYIFPPVELYKVRDRYFVADGNHRVAAGKELGIAYIDAHVIECVSNEEGYEPLYWRERSTFELATGSTAFAFSTPDTYRRMLSHLKIFRAEESIRLGYEMGLAEATQVWFHEVDGPLRELVRSEKLLERFANRTEDDFVFYLIYHHVGLLRAIAGGIGAVTYREAARRLLSSPGRTLVGRFHRFLRHVGHDARKLLEGIADMNT